MQSLSYQPSDSVIGGMPTPEQGLLAAILTRAVLDATGNGRVSSDVKYIREAQRWLLAPITNEEFTFGYVCQHLGLRPTDVRIAVKHFIRDRPRLEFPRLSLFAKVITPISDLR